MQSICRCIQQPCSCCGREANKLRSMIELDELPSLITIANYVWCHEFLIFISRKGSCMHESRHKPVQPGLRSEAAARTLVTFDAEYRARANMPAIHGADDA